MQYRFFLGGCYESQAYTADQERTVNWIPERIEVPGGTSKLAFYPTPGFEVIHITGPTQGRAHLFMNGREFIVIGNIFFELDVDAAATFLGFVAMDSSPATISSNGDGGGQLFITSGGNGYLFVLATNTFSQIAALNGRPRWGISSTGTFSPSIRTRGACTPPSCWTAPLG